MNIFFLSSNPQNAAQYHNNRHVVKMRAETIQMMMANIKWSGTNLEHINILNSTGKPYRGGYVNHPCTKWMRESLGNFVWSFSLLQALEEEYQFRYGPKETHCGMVIKSLQNSWNHLFDCSKFKTNSFTSPSLAMPKKYQSDNFVESYRNYYIGEKRYMNNGKSMDDWGKREQPYWWK